MPLPKLSTQYVIFVLRERKLSEILTIIINYKVFVFQISKYSVLNNIYCKLTFRWCLRTFQYLLSFNGKFDMIFSLFKGLSLYFLVERKSWMSLLFWWISFQKIVTLSIIGCKRFLSRLFMKHPEFETLEGKSLSLILHTLVLLRCKLELN